MSAVPTTTTTWDEILATVKRLGRNAFVSSVSVASEPHLAVVWVVEVDGELYFVSDRAAAKIRNLRANPATTVHWQVTEEGPNEGLQLLIRARTEQVEDPERRRHLWDSGAWGDLGQWYGGVDDPTLSFVRLAATQASVVEKFGSGARRSWRAAT